MFLYLGLGEQLFFEDGCHQEGEVFVNDLGYVEGFSRGPEDTFRSL